MTMKKNFFDDFHYNSGNAALDRKIVEQRFRKRRERKQSEQDHGIVRGGAVPARGALFKVREHRPAGRSRRGRKLQRIDVRAHEGSLSSPALYRPAQAG